MDSQVMFDYFNQKEQLWEDSMCLFKDDSFIGKKVEHLSGRGRDIDAKVFTIVRNINSNHQLLACKSSPQSHAIHSNLLMEGKEKTTCVIMKLGRFFAQLA